MANEVITVLQSLFVHTETVEGTENGGFPASADAILAANLTRPTPQDYNERTFAQAMGTRQGAAGAISQAGIKFDSEIKGNGTTSVPEISSLLYSVFGSITTDTFLSTGVNTGASSSTSISYTGGSGNITKGNGILVETGASTNKYEMVWVTSTTVVGAPATGVITVSPALSFGTPNATARIKPTTTYTVMDTGHPSLSIYNYLTGGAGSSQVLQLVGCRGNLKFAVKKAGDIPMCSWDFKAWKWALSGAGTRPSPTYNTAQPPVALATKFKIANVLTDVLDLELDIGNVVTPKMSQNSATGVYGMVVTNHKPSGKFRVHADSTSLAHFTGWAANTQITLSAQYGQAQFGSVGWYCPQAERKVVAYGDDGGISTNDAEFNANILSGQDSLYFSVG